MAKVWRIVSPRYTSEILSGAGAAQFRGRWNRGGEQMIYTAMSQSLSMLERLVYMISPFPEISIGVIEVPDECIKFLGIEEAEIKVLLTDHRESRNIGSGWISSNLSVALAVPSVHIHPSNWLEEHNYESISQIQGLLSQANSPDPAAFERGHYMKLLKSYRV